MLLHKRKYRYLSKPILTYFCNLGYLIKYSYVYFETSMIKDDLQYVEQNSENRSYHRH